MPAVILQHILQAAVLNSYIKYVIYIYWDGTDFYLTVTSFLCKTYPRNEGNIF